MQAMATTTTRLNQNEQREPENGQTNEQENPVNFSQDEWFSGDGEEDRDSDNERVKVTNTNTPGNPTPGNSGKMENEKN